MSLRSLGSYRIITECVNSVLSFAGVCDYAEMPAVLYILTGSGMKLPGVELIPPALDR